MTVSFYGILQLTNPKGIVSPPAIENFVSSIVNEHPVVIFTNTHCPTCQQAIRLLKDVTNDNLYVVYVDEKSASTRRFHFLYDIWRYTAWIAKNIVGIRAELKRRTNRKVVPWIYIDGKFVGDRKAIQKLDKDGELRKLVRKAMAKKEEL